MLSVIIIAATLPIAGPATAQNQPVGPNAAASPGFGVITLSAGFEPDPVIVPIVSGGSISAASVGARCTGHISRAPDVRVSYTAGDRPLIISVESEADTTLVIHGPGGTWHCDDDGGVNGGNPSIRWTAPQTGDYAVWVGSYRSGTNSRARLHISEVRSQ